MRISSNLNMKQKKLLYKSMPKSQFSCCPVVWMFCSRQFNNLTNKMYEWSLRISYIDKKTSYHNLLKTHNEFTIHQRNLQVFMTEIYKIVNAVSPSIMNSLFEYQSNENIIIFFKHSRLTSEEQ